LLRRLPRRPAAFPTDTALPFLPALLQSLKRVPGERGQRQRGQRQEAEEYCAQHPNLVGDHLGEKPGKPADYGCRKSAFADVRVEVDSADAGQDADEVGHEHAQADDEDRRAFHVQLSEPVEAGQCQTDTKQGNAERTGAEHAPESMPDVLPNGPSEREREEGQTDEQAQNEARDRAKSPTGVCAHTGTGMSVIRRSWK